MAREVVKRDYGQAKSGYSPFAKSSPKAAAAPCFCYDAWNGKRWFTVKCGVHQ